MIDTSKRWFVMPGEAKPGERTLHEQMLGVEPALAEARGKTVLDLGCAEGLISLEFAKAGASVMAIEALEYHLEVARQLCAGHNVTFLCKKLEGTEELGEYDIVLALAIIHKLPNVEAGLRSAARACRDLFVFRGPNHMTSDGWMRSKHYASSVNVVSVMTQEGFILEAAQPGARGEPVLRWRRRGVG